MGSARKAVSSATSKLGPASAAFRLYDPLNLTGADQSGLFKGGLSDILLGKKQGTIPPDQIANMIRATQMKGISELNQALSAPVGQVVGAQAARESKGILSAAQDARRRAQQLMAQRGLAGSSIGLGQERSITQQAGEQLGALQASLPERIRQMQLSNAQARIGVGGLGTTQGIRFAPEQGQRTGGFLGIASALAPLAGQAAGAYKDYQTGQAYAR